MSNNNTSKLDAFISENKIRLSCEMKHLGVNHGNTDFRYYNGRTRKKI